MLVRLLVVIFSAALMIAAPAWAQADRPLHLSAESALLLAPDGTVLFAKNPSEDHAPASLVKLMTLYLACEDLEAGKVQWDEPVTISRRAADTPRYRMGLRAGEEVPFRTLLEGVAIASANDAATAVAEHLGGSEDTFVDRMNAKAEQLGLRSTHFANPHGLPDPGGRSTAQDMARLIGHVVQDYPASRPLLGGASFIYRGRVHARRIPLFQDPGGVQALKTGFTREAGYNLAIAAWRAGQRFLLIVMGAQTRSLSFRDAQQLLRYGFIESGIEPPETPRKPALPPPTRRPPDRRRHGAVAAVHPARTQAH
jgi:serine-type D-Ala-D-Ala carboxypeptidase (penicillin-binding protein 5/6)